MLKWSTQPKLFTKIIILPQKFKHVSTSSPWPKHIRYYGFMISTKYVSMFDSKNLIRHFINLNQLCSSEYESWFIPLWVFVHRFLFRRMRSIDIPHFYCSALARSSLNWFWLLWICLWQTNKVRLECTHLHPGIIRMLAIWPNAIIS